MALDGGIDDVYEIYEHLGGNLNEICQSYLILKSPYTIYPGSKVAGSSTSRWPISSVSASGL
jgi:hypothetical protein